MSSTTLLEECSLEELLAGFRYLPDKQAFLCLVCGQTYYQGLIYTDYEIPVDAEKAVRLHLQQQHGSMFDTLLTLDKKQTGLTEHQKDLLRLFRQGISDAEIAQKLQIGSVSTVRNHRFSLREKEKQARLLLATLLLSTPEAAARENQDAFLPSTSAKEKKSNPDKILRTFFPDGPRGPLSKLPGKEKRLAVVLQHIAVTWLQPQQTYTKDQLLALLAPLYSDAAGLLKLLLSYKLLTVDKKTGLHQLQL